MKGCLPLKVNFLSLDRPSYQKVCGGGWWWWWLRVILVLSFGLSNCDIGQSSLLHQAFDQQSNRSTDKTKNQQMKS